MCRVVISGLLDPTVSKFDARNSVKMAYIVHETLHMDEFCPSYIMIIDFNHASPRHLALYPFGLIKKILDFGLVRMTALLFLKNIKHIHN
jgi:hypothetical protein